MVLKHNLRVERRYEWIAANITSYGRLIRQVMNSQPGNENLQKHR